MRRTRFIAELMNEVNLPSDADVDEHTLERKLKQRGKTLDLLVEAQPDEKDDLDDLEARADSDEDDAVAVEEPDADVKPKKVTRSKPKPKQRGKKDKAKKTADKTKDAN